MAFLCVAPDGKIIAAAEADVFARTAGQTVIAWDIDPDEAVSGWWYDHATQRLQRRIQATVSPNPVRAGDLVEVIAVLPQDTSDTEVTFALESGGVVSEPALDTEVTFALESGGVVSEPALRGQAKCLYTFNLSGTYVITVSSPHHGSSVVEVVVQ